MSSGGSALSGQRLLISNLLNGLDVYSLPAMQLERTFTHTISVNVILQLVVTSPQEWVVVGGDDGFVRIFDMHSGNFLFSLLHAERKSSGSVAHFITNS